MLNSKILDKDIRKRIDEIENPKYSLDFINYFEKNNFEVLESLKKTKFYWVEINLLKKIYNPWDQIYLFFSDTNWGHIVKEILKWYFKTDYAKNLYKDDDFEVLEENFITINWFTIDDKDSFKKEAIPYFFEKLDNIKSKIYWDFKSNNLKDLEKYSKIDTIMCPVWWYKSLIPYASLYSMVNSWDIKYIFEDSDEMIDLPSGALTNLSWKILLENKINFDIFCIENLWYNYDFKDWLELIIWIKNFITYWKSNELSKICEKLKNIFINNKEYWKEKEILGKLEKYLLNLTDAFDLIRIKDINEIISDILIIEISGLNDVLLKNSIYFLQTELKKVSNDNIINWYYDRWRYAEVVLLMRELLIDFMGKLLNLEYNNKDIRLKITSSLKIISNKKLNKDDENYEYLSEQQEKIIKDKFQDNEAFWDTLTQKRNNFAHLNEESVDNMKKWIIKLYGDYKKITSW